MKVQHKFVKVITIIPTKEESIYDNHRLLAKALILNAKAILGCLYKFEGNGLSDSLRRLSIQ